MSFISELTNKSIAVVGGGITGASVINFLEGKCSKITLFDDQSTSITGIKSRVSPAEYDLFDLAIISPGWKRGHKTIKFLLDLGVPLLSELDFAWKIKCEIAPSQRWIALTGTNGKTTTIQMVQSIFNAGGVNGRVCGNVGEPVIAVLNGDHHYDVLALEVSSFQIEWSELPHYEAVAILNIAEDHIDWHGSFEEYANTKLKILDRCEIAVLNFDDIEVSTRTSSWLGRKIFYSLATPQLGELGIVEELLIDRAFSTDSSIAEVIAELIEIQPTVPHNVANALAAAGLTLSLGISHYDVRAGLKAFRSDHHRLEEVAVIGDITWIDDSKATNPHAAIASIMSFFSVVWIAGGLAKGANMDTLIIRTANRLKAVILIGTDREVIAQSLATHAPNVPIYRLEKHGDVVEFMKRIVEKANEIAEGGDTVLLAPACASMDQFDSYVQRGECFSMAVRALEPIPGQL